MEKGFHMQTYPNDTRPIVIIILSIILVIGFLALND